MIAVIANTCIHLHHRDLTPNASSLLFLITSFAHTDGGNASLYSSPNASSTIILTTSSPNCNLAAPRESGLPHFHIAPHALSSSTFGLTVSSVKTQFHSHLTSLIKSPEWTYRIGRVDNVWFCLALEFVVEDKVETVRAGDF